MQNKITLQTFCNPFIFHDVSDYGFTDFATGKSRYFSTKSFPVVFQALVEKNPVDKCYKEKKILPYISITLRLSDYSGEEYLQEGWPVLIPGYGDKWFFIDKNKCIKLCVPLNTDLKKLRNILPLNQFNRGFENEDLIELNRGDLEKELIELREKFIARLFTSD